jgi:hypothetical protein
VNTCGMCKYKTLDENGFTNNIYPDSHFVDGRYVDAKTQEPVKVDADGDLLPIRTFFLCGRIKQKDYLENGEELTAKAIVIDGSGYYAALCVDDDFGCNQWEAKP